MYIDIGDDTLWLLPRDGDAYGEEGEGCIEEEFFIQRGVGVVGLVAMGAVPGAATVAGGGGRPGARAGPGKDEVDILLLNEGLDAFDNGTTVEAALLRAARRRRFGGSGGVDADSATSGTVRNMLLARWDAVLHGFIIARCSCSSSKQSCFESSVMVLHPSVEPEDVPWMSPDDGSYTKWLQP